MLKLSSKIGSFFYLALSYGLSLKIMMLKKQLFFLFFFSITLVFSQETIKHKVVSGESIYAIAKKYKVTEADIYQLNPKVKGAVLQLNSIIIIPNKNKNKAKTTETSDKLQEHIVTKGETLFAISKQYGISISKLKEINPELDDKGLQIGSKIKLKTPKSQPEVVVEEEITPGYHVVKPKETKYKIAKKYGLTVAELDALNPEVSDNLQIGFELIVDRNLAIESNDLTNEDLQNSQSSLNTLEESESKPMSLAGTEKADFIIDAASRNLGTRYRSGGTSSNGFDCSGLVCVSFEQAEHKLPRSSHEMAKVGFKVSKAKAQKGDLIFFKTRGNRISHVGIITEVSDNDIKFIHSSTSSGVIISSTNEPYYARRFVQINRVLE